MAIKRLSNGRWEATYRDPGNKERQGTFPNQREAKAWLAANNSDIARGTWIDPRAGRIILRGYADKWIGTRTDIRLSTAAKYRQLLAQHVLPTLGSHTLVALSPSAVRAWWAKLHGQYPATAANAYRLLSTICNTAVEDGLIAKSPCRVKGAGADRAAERPVGSIAEIDAAAAAAPGHWRLAILLAFWCQLRRGEVLALQRKDFDELHGTLSVCQTWSMAGSRPTLGPPKTDAGRRNLAVPSNVLPILSEHLVQHVGPDSEAWLFPGQEGQPAHPRSLDHAWAKARQVVSREDLRFHDVRHSGLTLAAATGASTAELMRRGGHASPQAALRYQHATEDRDRILADALADLAKRAPVVPIEVPAENLAEFPRTSVRSGQHRQSA